MKALPVRIVEQINHERVMKDLAKGPTSYRMTMDQVHSLRQTAHKAGLRLNYKRVLKGDVVVGWTLTLEEAE